MDIPLTILAAWVMISALDDLFILAAWIVMKVRRAEPPVPDEADLEATAEQPVAIFVAAWREHAVIGAMLRQNLRNVRYRNFDIFVGTYPNDPLTIAAVDEVAAADTRVYRAECSRPGGTSKSDCLNHIWNRMVDEERRRGCRYDLVLIHDAEDIVHADELRWLNWYGQSYDMIQIPVLPVPTPLWSLTHGVYCDDFSEFHTKDLPVRAWLGGFVPSSGVGTAVRRDWMEALAEETAGMPFGDGSLTEDYELGHRLHRMGARQVFVPLRRFAGNVLATREHFPDSIHRAVRQRSRWVTGIALQAWRSHGWGTSWAERFWFWRDRKGLLGNPASLAANAAAVCSLAMGMPDIPWPVGLCVLGIAGLGVASRTLFSARHFPAIAPLAILRIPVANLINTLATLGALGRFGLHLATGRPLAWQKTAHRYPDRAELQAFRRPLGELLVEAGDLSRQVLHAALAAPRNGLRLGEFLRRAGLVSERAVLRALAKQHGVEFWEECPPRIAPGVQRCLPREMLRQWRLAPVAIRGGRLYLAADGLPGEEVRWEVSHHLRLELRIVLVTSSDFNGLIE